ncbi:MAG: DUF1223 domain-containing protein [Sphingorhabdus sp.]
MRYIVLTLLPLLAACEQQPSILGDAIAAAPAVKNSGPIVVELYQSQGCSSCPPANRALNAVATRRGIIALNFSVTYWDRLGWKDTFGDKRYTQRQYAYAKAFREHNVYTPQMVLNGRTAIVGNRAGELNKAIKSMRPIRGGPSISAAAGRVTVGAGKGSADVWLVRYDPRIQNVRIRAGENTGRTIPHRNIVRRLVKLGKWSGKAASYPVPAKRSPKYRSAILVQSSGHREIIAARKF